MSDTQRTRAQLLSIFADNVTGQISPQDFRDFVVTVMEAEFAYAGDFWKQPSPRSTLTDKTARGWIDYSQTVGSDVSFMNILYMTTSGIWKKADVAVSAKTGIFGMAMDSYASGAATAQILRKGLVYNSSFSATFSGYIGKPIYLASGVAGSVTITTPGATNSVLIMGWVCASDDGGAAIGKWRFDPDWAIKGV